MSLVNVSSAASIGRDLRDIAPLIYIGVALAALFIVFKSLKGLQTSAEKFTEPLANAIVSFRGNPAEIADASKWITLPNGARITWDQVAAAGSSLKSDNTFYWQGVRYLVTGRGTDGTWQTKLH